MKFDDFLQQREIIEKYADVRTYFSKIQSHKDLIQAKSDLLNAIKGDEIDDVPKDVIDFFVEERKRQLGPDIIYKDDIRHSPEALSSNIQRALQSQISNARPSMG